MNEEKNERRERAESGMEFYVEDITGWYWFCRHGFPLWCAIWLSLHNALGKGMRYIHMLNCFFAAFLSFIYLFVCLFLFRLKLMFIIFVVVVVVLIFWCTKIFRKLLNIYEYTSKVNIRQTTLTDEFSNNFVSQQYCHKINLWCGCKNHLIAIKDWTISMVFSFLIDWIYLKKCVRKTERKVKNFLSMRKLTMCPQQAMKWNESEREWKIENHIRNRQNDFNTRRWIKLCSGDVRI